MRLPVTSLVTVLIAWMVGVESALALEQQFEDLSASVEVAPVFSLSIDNLNLAFGLVSPETTAILGRDHFFHEIKCRSNSGRPWYVKGQVVSLKQLETGFVLEPSALEWRIAESTGAAEPIGGRESFQKFTTGPVLMYASQSDDQRGRPVTLRLQYSLRIPSSAPAGTYVGQVTFTMTEGP